MRNNMKLRRATATCALLTLLPSCGLVPYPTNEEILSANVGPQPAPFAIKASVERLLDSIVRDLWTTNTYLSKPDAFSPVGKLVTYGETVKGWYRKPFTITDKFGWAVPCTVRFRNRLGSYTSPGNWLFFFVYGECVAWQDQTGGISEIGPGGLTAGEAHVGMAPPAASGKASDVLAWIQNQRRDDNWTH